jgi:hypothetical protein
MAVAAAVLEVVEVMPLEELEVPDWEMGAMAA